jgi:diguanylate cyclase (GGDEF)-like protein
MATTNGSGRSRRSLRAFWPLVLIMVLMLAASVASVLVVSWTRAGEHALGLWSMAEHQAVHELTRYAQTGDPEHFRRFEQELAVPAAFRAARLQSRSGDPDLAVVRAHLLDAGVPASDVQRIIHLFGTFGHVPTIVKAQNLWTQGGALTTELAQAGRQLQREFQNGGDAARVGELLAQAESVHARIRPLLREFGQMMRLTAEQIVQLLLIVLPLSAAALALVGRAIYRALDLRAGAVTRALHELTERLEHQATHDALTGLVNRHHFEALLTEALARHDKTGEDAALLYFDLDQFKVVNDTCGHAAGDELLRQLAWRLRGLVADKGTLGRLGGDEFGLLLPRHSVAEAQPLAEHLRQEIAGQRFYWNERMFAVSASIGLLALGRDMRTVADALSAADQACYLAKENGRDRVHLYQRDDRQVQQRWGEMHWVERLQTALDHHEFTLVAQEIRPVVHRQQRRRNEDAPRRRFELLLRMTAPDGQLVPPMAFIPAAERYGLMPKVDRWVIARACHELAALREGGLPLPTCMVNLSGASASDPQLADYVAECLRESGLSGRHLGVELTETAAVHNLDACSELMTRLRKLGCPIALDDFGSGMSSFSYLRNLPIDYLKIDRAFIRNVASDPIDHAMVETIQRIGGIMGVRTVAEGVESAEVMTALALIGVDFAQGNWVRRAVPLVQVHTVVGSPDDSGLQRKLSQSALSARSSPGR